MKRFSISLWIVFILIAGLVLLTSCVTMPEAVPGLYVNSAPDFTIKYPTDWKEIKKLSPNMVFRASPDVNTETPNFAVSVSPSRGLPLKNFPKVIPGLFKQVFPNTSGHRITHEKMITLECGTPAVEFDLEWEWGLLKGQKPVKGVEYPLKIKTTFVLAYKDNKLVWVDSTNMADKPLDVNKRITHSLKFY